MSLIFSEACAVIQQGFMREGWTPHKSFPVLPWEVNTQHTLQGIHRASMKYCVSQNETKDYWITIRSSCRHAQPPWLSHYFTSTKGAGSIYMIQLGWSVLNDSTRKMYLWEQACGLLRTLSSLIPSLKSMCVVSDLSLLCYVCHNHFQILCVFPLKHWEGDGNLRSCW